MSEEITQATETTAAAEPKTYTQEEVNAMMAERVSRAQAKWQKEKEAEISEAQKLAEMNAAEKAQYERDKLQKQLEELMAAQTRAEMTRTARKMLSDEGINVTDDILDALVSTDAEKTQAAVKSFSALFTSAVAEAVKDKLKSPAPRTGSQSVLTKEEILAIKDKYQRQKAISENMNLFK